MVKGKGKVVGKGLAKGKPDTQPKGKGVHLSQGEAPDAEKGKAAKGKRWAERQGKGARLSQGEAPDAEKGKAAKGKRWAERQGKGLRLSQGEAREKRPRHRITGMVPVPSGRICTTVLDRIGLQQLQELSESLVFASDEEHATAPVELSNWLVTGGVMRTPNPSMTRFMLLKYFGLELSTVTSVEGRVYPTHTSHSSRFPLKFFVNAQGKFLALFSGHELPPSSVRAKCVFPKPKVSKPVYRLPSGRLASSSSAPPPAGAALFLVNGGLGKKRASYRRKLKGKLCRRARSTVLAPSSASQHPRKGVHLSQGEACPEAPAPHPRKGVHLSQDEACPEAPVSDPTTRRPRTEDFAIVIPDGLVSFADVERALASITWPRSSRRKNIMADDDSKIQAFCLGLVHDYASGMVPSALTCRWPNLARLLNRAASTHFPGQVYTTIQLIRDHAAKLHVDSNNVGFSTAVAFGDFEGGELWHEDGRGNYSEILTRRLSGYSGHSPGAVLQGSVTSIKHAPFQFDATRPHRVFPFTGSRMSAVYFTRKEWRLASDEIRDALLSLGFHLPNPVEAEGDGTGGQTTRSSYEAPRRVLESSEPMRQRWRSGRLSRVSCKGVRP